MNIYSEDWPLYLTRLSFLKHINDIYIDHHINPRKLNKEGMLKALTAQNDKIEDDPDYKTKMTNYELEVLEKMIDELDEPHQTRDLTDREMVILQKKLMKFQGTEALPVIDLLRLFVLHHSSISQFDTLTSGNLFLMYCLKTFSTLKNDAKTGRRVLRTTLKLLCNMFKCNATGFVNCDTVIQTFLAQCLSSCSKVGLKLILSLLHNLSMYLALNDKKKYKSGWIFQLISRLGAVFDPRNPMLGHVLGNLVYLDDGNVGFVRSDAGLVAALGASKLELGEQKWMSELCKAVSV